MTHPPAQPHSHPDLQRLARSLADRPGVVQGDVADSVRWAAVAILLREGAAGALELLLIRRADRDGDPWSGHVALPGGRRDPGDASLEATAVREVWEEVGVDVYASGQVIGTLDDLAPRTPTLPAVAVRPFVAVVGDVTLELNPEVADAAWVGVELLRDPATTRTSPVLVRGQRHLVQSFVVGEYVVWGMTERILRQFVELL